MATKSRIMDGDTTKPAHFCNFVKDFNIFYHRNCIKTMIKAGTPDFYYKIIICVFYLYQGQHAMMVQGESPGVMKVHSHSENTSSCYECIGVAGVDIHVKTLRLITR